MKNGIVETFKNRFQPNGENDVIDILKDDHKRVDGFFKQFDASTSTVEKKNLLSKIINELTVHSTVEERLVYPLLEDEEPEQTEEALQEHHVVKLVLKELEQMSPNEAQTKAKVKVLHEMVQHHIKEEEKTMLPKLKKLDVDREALGRKVLKEKNNLMANSTAKQTRVTQQKRADLEYIGRGTSPEQSTGTAKNTGKIKTTTKAKPRERSETARKIAGTSRASVSKRKKAS